VNTKGEFGVGNGNDAGLNTDIESRETWWRFRLVGGMVGGAICIMTAVAETFSMFEWARTSQGGEKVALNFANLILGYVSIGIASHAIDHKPWMDT